MHTKSRNKNLSDTKVVLFHKIPNRLDQESKCSSADHQKLLTLSTPIKLNDGTLGLERRTIPLRIDNGRLSKNSTEIDNKIASLKRNIEPPALALPINQLNKESPTFVKNEDGQIMGKLIPLGKISDIAHNSLSPISSVSSSVSSATSIGNLKCYTNTSRRNRVLKLNDESPANLKPKEEINGKSTADAVEAQSIANTSSVNSSEVKSVKKQVIIIPDNEPKKRVRLVLKGCKNMAMMNQTSGKMKLISLDNRKSDTKLNLQKMSNASPIFQPQIVDVRSCMSNGTNELNDSNFEDNESDLNFGKVEFDVDDILEEDPLDISAMVKFKDEAKTQNSCSRKDNILSTHLVVDSESTVTSAETEQKFDPVTNNVTENMEEIQKFEKIDVDYDELYRKFGINKKNVTKTETAMLFHILSLKTKLLQGQKNKVQPLTALHFKEYLDNNNLSNNQKRFIESQLRNPSRLQIKSKFMKNDLVMARDILKATGPRGYNNLRKLFSLPDISSVVRAISRT